MIFDPNDPYPLFAVDSVDYLAAQIHSETVDAWLGLDTDGTEKTILAKLYAEPPETRKTQEGEELWVGLPVRALLTPYTELRAFLQQLNPASGSTIVDLGAGYGRMAFVIDKHWPRLNFIGYEYVPERVHEGQRVLAVHCTNAVKLLQADLTDSSFRPVEASYYFLYDYGSPQAIEKTLQDLRQIASTRHIVVVGRGRRSRDIIERHHPWLSGVVDPEHFVHYSIYRSGT